MIKEKRKFYLANNDRVFKAIFLNENDKDYHLLRKLLSEALERDVKEIKLLPTEMSIKEASERLKRVDALIDIGDLKINLEVNNTYDEVIRIRNLNYFSDYYSSRVKVGNKYDTKTKYVLLSLNFKEEKLPIMVEYKIYSEEERLTYTDTFKIREINIDKYRKFWYDKNELQLRKTPILVFLSLKESELESFVKRTKIKEVREVYRRLKEINESEIFIPKISREESEEMVFNTRLELAEEKGLEQGLEKGLEQGSLEKQIEIAKNMLAKKTDINYISEVTGLSVEEIENLK